MADPAQLRKCEDLLGKLPEKPPTRVRNPVWVFLKEIEGFDTDRASECLVKLLDKHYDTIGVLKLATKRDLVEDAGILPGDALRIVAAAKEYVAPRDVDHSSELTSQHDASKPGGVLPSEAHLVQGVEHRQHAYRPPALREKTVIFTPPVASEASTHAYFPPMMQEKKANNVAQESLKCEEQLAVSQAAPKQGNAKEVKVANQGAAPKQEAVKDAKVVNQAAPKQDAVKDAKVSAQTIPVGITYPHTCGICNVKCISEINCRMHYNGRMHRAKLAEVQDAVKEAKQPAQTRKAVNTTKNSAQTEEVVWEAKQPSQSIPVAPLHACGVCNVKCGSEFVLRSHFNGKKHAQKMQLATDTKDNRPTAFLHCSICIASSTCKRNLVMHFNGKRHAQNMKVDSVSGDSSYYSDSESDCF